ncbi:nucleolar protein 4-like isoform X2 [Pogonomyrmex barbatus]|uniref:Nucleolar protein 4-like isoform X2 n=1 Tax=Pogonomyrmex barbatus TaxID=144034 RepID=A0A6I9W0T0_9HYME|nr:nucleolar protein 4-like isoform X2 [Pogonomyrmex barbatus]
MKSENISTPEPTDISEDDHYPISAGALMKDPDKLKLMLLAWNYNLQAQAAQAANAALSPNNSSTTTATTVGTPVTSQSAISTANNTINNSTLTDSRNGTSELVDMPAGTVPNLSGVASVGGEDMASLWASYAMGFKKTPPPASSGTPSRSDRDRESSPPGGEGTGSAHDETSSSGNKEDEDDDDIDADEGLDPRHHDPERLKAFNMFVRLFVDENLDRIVPISKQPKEKIQAIIDSCTRQFPEFAERARKRIRTYLKSCRRNKRGREGPWDAARPTPAHLTSVQAEQILATACENESDNAKRMRVGLEPVSQPMPTLPAATQTDVRSSLEHFSSTPVKSLPCKREDTPPASLTSLAPLTSLANLPSSTISSTPLSIASASKLLTTDNKSLMSQSTIVSSTVNGVASGGAPTMYRPNFSQAFQRAGPTVPPTLSAGLYPTQSFTSSLLTNGPTDLSMKNPSKPLLSHKLNSMELNAVKQLIGGYRESAAFLLRSADELEQLLLHQP